MKQVTLLLKPKTAVFAGSFFSIPKVQDHWGYGMGVSVNDLIRLKKVMGNK